MKIEYLLYGILAAAVIGRFIWQVIDTTSGQVLTGRAVVISKRVSEGSYRSAQRNAKTWYVDRQWNYLVTFRLSDGEMLELHTFENEYHALKVGMSGQLTWHKQNMSAFEADMEVIV